MDTPTKEEVTDLVRWLAPQFGLSPDLIIRQCNAESAFHQAAVSPCGALGLMQLMPATAKELGVDPKKWRENITGAMRYMQRLTKKYGDCGKALAAYNWGPGHLDKLLTTNPKDWSDHLPKETKNYLIKIL